MSKEEKEQIIKCRDDADPIKFDRTNKSDSENKPFHLVGDDPVTWVKANESFGTDTLRTHIEPWLTALFQSEHLSCLAGSGLTHGLHRMATSEGLPGMGDAQFDPYDDEVSAEKERAAKIAGRGEGNIEDQIRAANELLRGLEILELNEWTDFPDPMEIADFRVNLDRVLKEFAQSILKGEEGLLNADQVKRTEAFTYLVSFLMSFASRTGTRDRLHIFTTNYDRYIEAGADVAGLRLIDRFVGTLAPIFRSSRLDVDLHYNPPGIRGEPRYLEGVARFTKLHGSVDWLQVDRDIRRLGLPFGAPDITPFVDAALPDSASSSRLMIYPNAAKDRETAAYPYVELFRDFAAAVCRPNSTLVCYGYSFGDEHINRVIEDMLTIPSTHLVVISFDDPLGRIMKTYNKLGRRAQISLLIGDHLGDLRSLVDHYLPKPAIDRTTIRMADLLKARWSTKDPNNTEDSTASNPQSKGIVF